MSTGKRIIDLPPATPLQLTDLMEVSQFVSSQVSGKTTLADLQAFLSSPTLLSVLAAGNITGGNPIKLTSGDNIQSATNSYNNLYIEPLFNALTAEDPTSNEQTFYQTISGAGGSFTQIKSTDLSSGNYTNILIAQEVGVLTALNSIGAYSTQLEWSPSVWKVNSSYSTFAGLQYNADYSVNYTNRSLIDKGYGAATYLAISTASSTYMPLAGGTFTGNVNGVTPTEITYLSGVTSPIQTQINNINSGLSWKLAVRVATTANITLSGTQTIDGIAVIAGDRVLVKNQSTGADNGLYLCAAGAWTRTTDATTGGTGSTGVLGATVTVEEGTVNADIIYTCSTDAPITIGVTTLTFVKTSATTYTGSNGITLTGNNFTLDNSYFTGEATLSGGAVTLTNSAVIGKVLTGYVSGAGTVGATDTILQAIQKLNGNTSAISGAYVTTVNGASGAIVNVALTTGTLAQFAATTSAQLAGVISDETGSGSLVFGTSPTFTTDLTSPLIIGGTAVSSTLSLKGTSGNGTSTVAAINFLVGNNGATTAAKIYNNGIFNIGNAALDTTGLSIFTVGQGTAVLNIGELSSALIGIWGTGATAPTANNYALRIQATQTYLNASGAVFFQQNANTVGQYDCNTWVFAPVATTTNSTTFTFTSPNHTTQTAGANKPEFLLTLPTGAAGKQFATGAQAALDFVSFTQPTVSFVGSSTSTLAAAFSLSGAVNAGTNAIITTSVGLLIKSAAVNGTGTVGTSYGAYINAQTGATTNAALYVNGSSYYGNASLTNAKNWRYGDGTAWLDIGQKSAAEITLWGTQTPSGTNYALNMTTAYTELNNSTAVYININNSAKITFNSTNTTFSQAGSSVTAWTFNSPTGSAISAGSNTSTFIVNGSTRSWQTGTVAAAYLNYFTGNTLNATAASTFTVAANFVTDIITATGNGTIATAVGFYNPATALTNVTNGYGAYFNAPTGATNNFAAFFNGVASFNSTVRLKNYTVATLPAGVQGDLAYVTDALTPAFLVTIVGGGATVAPVFYNGTNWVSI